DLVWLAVGVQSACWLLSPTRFIRVYTLGSLVGGLAFVGLSLMLGRRGFLMGGELSVAALIAALAVLHPRERARFGKSLEPKRLQEVTGTQYARLFFMLSCLFVL